MARVYSFKALNYQRGIYSVAKHQTLKLKIFRFFSGVFPESFRQKAGKTPETDRKKAETFSEKNGIFKVLRSDPNA